jgi:hypothetical protein
MKLKRIVFLIIASLMVLGLVLPGCAGGGGGGGYTDQINIQGGANGLVIIGICADSGHTTGDFNKYGIILAANQINLAGGINISGTSHNLTYTVIDTDEATEPTGAYGKIALQGAIDLDSFDILMGGYRTEALLNYYGTAMAAKRIFFDAGAATEILCRPVVSSYATYKYFFKTTPYNEYFLAKGVLKIVNTVAIGIRAARNLTANATLQAVIIAEDLKWSKDEQVPKITAGLPALNIVLNTTYYVSATETGPVTAALSDAIVTKNITAAIIIPILSGSPGAAYGVALKSYIAANLTGAMSVGIVVYDQIKQPWGASLAQPPGANQPGCAYHVGLDTWGDGVNQTGTTAAFLAAFSNLTGGEYPMYTAATYDACFVLKACLEAIPSSYNATSGVTNLSGADVVAWYENPANAKLGTTGTSYLFPRPLATPTGLTSVQVSTIYNLTAYGWNYTASQWLVPPHTAHDLAYGVNINTGIGTQWQWSGAIWKKVGVWPRIVAGFNATDQYGDWGFAYQGAVNLTIPDYVTAYPWP